MIAASSLAFPGTKTLGLWWSQLAPFTPLQMWVGHLFIHRLDVLAEVVQSENVDPLQLLLLRAVGLDENEEFTAGGAPPSPWAQLQRLDRRLHLGSDVLGRLLDDLRGQGLLTPAPPQPFRSPQLGERVALTESGRLAVTTAKYPKRDWQRRELAFVERLRPDGARLLPPHFLALDPPRKDWPVQRWQPDPGAGFDFDWVGQAVHQPSEWKEAFAFPSEIGTVADPKDDGPEPPAWQRIAVDRSERLLAAVIAVGTRAGVPDRILVFGVRQDGWELQGDKPVGSFAWSGVPEFQDLANTPNWSKAWRDWCQTRQLPAAEVQACTFAQTGGWLDVQAPAPLLARTNDVLKGDTWLLAGEGYLCSAANVRLRMPA